MERTKVPVTYVIDIFKQRRNRALLRDESFSLPLFRREAVRDLMSFETLKNYLLDEVDFKRFVLTLPKVREKYWSDLVTANRQNERYIRKHQRIYEAHFLRSRSASPRRSGTSQHRSRSTSPHRGINSRRSSGSATVRPRTASTGRRSPSPGRASTCRRSPSPRRASTGRRSPSPGRTSARRRSPGRRRRVTRPRLKYKTKIGYSGRTVGALKNNESAIFIQNLLRPEKNKNLPGNICRGIRRVCRYRDASGMYDRFPDDGSDGDEYVMKIVYQ